MNSKVNIVLCLSAILMFSSLGAKSQTSNQKAKDAQSPIVLEKFDEDEDKTVADYMEETASRDSAMLASMAAWVSIDAEVLPTVEETIQSFKEKGMSQESVMEQVDLVYFNITDPLDLSIVSLSDYINSLEIINIARVTAIRDDSTLSGKERREKVREANQAAKEEYREYSAELKKLESLAAQVRKSYIATIRYIERNYKLK